MPLTFNLIAKNLDWSANQSGLLIAEDSEGNYEPVEIVCSITEAEEMIASDERVRTACADDLCPERYVLFLRSSKGRFVLAGEWRCMPADSPPNLS